MTFSIDIPHFKCFIRKPFLYDWNLQQTGYIPVRVFGMTSIPGRAVGFNLITNQGAQFARVPIHALVWKEDCEKLPLDWLELWDCLSYQPCAIAYSYLSELRCRTILKDGKWYDGEYMFTIDWAGGDWAEDPSEHKCGHVLKLDNGCFAIQPNNRIIWADPSFITEQLTKNPGYKIHTRRYKSESFGKWISESNDNFFYDLIDETLSSDYVADSII
ncbi:MAG: hypothetical protein ACKOQ2_27530 [Dolichospermum sp.]